MSPPGARAPATTVMEGLSLDTDGTEPAPQPEPRRTGWARRVRRRFTLWKVVVTVTLLAALATAVTLVLLQSAGIIHLSILGPTA